MATISSRLAERFAGFLDRVDRSAAAPRRSGRRGFEGAGDMLEDVGVGASAGEGDADAAGGFDDAGGDLDEADADGGELGVPQRCGGGYGLPQLPHQPICGGVEDEAHLVGIGGSARGAIALQLGLVELDEVFGLATSTIERVVDVLGATKLDRGDDEADIEAHSAGFDPRDDPAFGRPPGFGGVASLGITAQHAQSLQRPVGGTGIAAIDDDGIGMERLVAGQAEHIVDAVRLAPRHDLGAAVMAITA